MTVLFLIRLFQVVIVMVFRVSIIFFITAVLVLSCFFTFGFVAILALPLLFECSRFSFALELRFLVFTLTAESVEIVRIVVERVVFISAAVRGLFPETVACHHTQVSL